MAKIAQSKNISEKKVKAKSSSKASGFSKGPVELTPSQLQEVQDLAYQFYVDRGYAHGYDQEDWARAEAVVRSRIS